jgi:hypothetical protein
MVLHRSPAINLAVALAIAALARYESFRGGIL